MVMKKVMVRPVLVHFCCLRTWYQVWNHHLSEVKPLKTHQTYFSRVPTHQESVLGAAPRVWDAFRDSFVVGLRMVKIADFHQTKIEPSTIRIAANTGISIFPEVYECSSPLRNTRGSVWERSGSISWWAYIGGFSSSDPGFRDIWNVEYIDNYRNATERFFCTSLDQFRSLRKPLCKFLSDSILEQSHLGFRS